MLRRDPFQIERAVVENRYSKMFEDPLVRFLLRSSPDRQMSELVQEEPGDVAYRQSFCFLGDADEAMAMEGVHEGSGAVVTSLTLPDSGAYGKGSGAGGKFLDGQKDPARLT